MLERLQKIIAASGAYSRREAERLMIAGRVKVNGKTVSKLGTQVDSHSLIVVDGVKISTAPSKLTVLFNKPRHVVVTRRDPEGRATVFDFLPKELQHLKPAGRLDYLSQGALLFSNDGEFLNQLMHPKFHLPKVYEVKIVPHPDERQLKRIAKGVTLDGKRTQEARVELISNRDTSSLIRITLHEGRNRQVRKMCEAVGLQVKELRRVAIGPIHLGRLTSGQWRVLSTSEIRSLRRAFANKSERE